MHFGQFSALFLELCCISVRKAAQTIQIPEMFYVTLEMLIRVTW